MNEYKEIIVYLALSMQLIQHLNQMDNLIYPFEYLLEVEGQINI